MLLRAIPALMLVVFAAGCPQAPTTPAPKSAAAEAGIRQLFGDFQKAVKERDGARLWEILADESREDAERKAKTIRDDFNKNNDGQRREEMAANLGVSQDELK